MSEAMFVRIPRAVFQEWCCKPWDELVIAAEAATDGLRVEANTTRDTDTAYMHEGAGTWGKNRSCLYQQNW